MHVSLLGIGCDAGKQLTAEAAAALQAAELILGAERVLAVLPTLPGKKQAEYRAEKLLSLLQESGCERACVVFSGDTGFYSGAARLLPLLQQTGLDAEVLPAVASLQTMAARLGMAWQEWKLCSAHGRDCDVLHAVMCGRPCFFLTDGTRSPSAICRELTEAGLGTLEACVGENLACPEERIVKGTAEQLAEQSFAALSVLWTAAAPVYPARVPGIPDSEFLREKVPMTKQMVRAAVLASLRVSPEDICWDIGAGTGSVSVELALHSRGVWAVERQSEAVALLRRNREKFCAWNLRVRAAEAPDGMDTLPKPDAVFVGGSGGHLREILNRVHGANPQARVCVSAIALETLSEAQQALNALGYRVEVTQLAVSRSVEAGGLHLLTAQNPVFLITGTQQEAVRT